MVWGGSAAPEAAMGLVFVWPGEVVPAVNEGRAVLDGVVEWARTRDDVAAVLLIDEGHGDQPVTEILLLVCGRMAFAADAKWHETALGGPVVAREGWHLSTVSSRLVRLANGTCVQFWLADAPSELLTEMAKRTRAAAA